MKLKIGRYELIISQCDKAALAFILLFLADSALTLGLLSNGKIEEAGWISAFLLKKGGSSLFFFGRIAFAVNLLFVLEFGRRKKISEKRCTFYYKLAFITYISVYVVGTASVNNFFGIFSG